MKSSKSFSSVNIQDVVSTVFHKPKLKHVRIDQTHISIRVHPGYEYDIARSRVKNSVEVCAWLGQIAEKTWGTPEVLGELVIALGWVNGDLRSFQDTH